MKPTLNWLRMSAVVLCVASGLPSTWAAEYLSNLNNPWIDPANPTCHCSIGDIHARRRIGEWA